MPRPIAAGVFGMARTMAAPSGMCLASPASRRPAAIGQKQRIGPGEAGEPRQHRVGQLRLDGEEDDGGRARQLVDEGQDVDRAVGEQIGDLGRRLGILHEDLPGIEAAREQPREDGSAHSAGTGQ